MIIAVDIQINDQKGQKNEHFKIFFLYIGGSKKRMVKLERHDFKRETVLNYILCLQE